MNTPKIEITKSWRKTLSMRFDSKGVLQVKAPKFLLRGQIDAFLKKHHTWIEREYEKIQERQAEKKYYLFGKEIESLTPTLSQGERERAPSFQLFPLEGKEANLKPFKKYYKQEAKAYIIPRCNELAQKYGFIHAGIRITSAQTRWGSCSSKKTLNFSYRLVMAPKACIDYVIIHELCHLREMNHSKKFWSEVAAIMPEYKQHEKHLKEEGWRYRV